MIAVLLFLGGLFLMYKRLFNKEKRVKLEGKLWFCMLVPFLLVWFAVHLLTGAKSNKGLDVIAAIFFIVEAFFSRKHFFNWIKKIFNPINWFRKEKVS